MCKEDRIFITIKHRNSCISIWEKVSCFITEEDNPIKIAKEYRKRIADHPSDYGYIRDHPRIPPSHFVWAIFKNLDDEKPFLHSPNWEKKSMDELIKELKKQFPNEDELNILGVYMITKLQEKLVSYKESNLSRLNHWKGFGKEYKNKTINTYFLVNPDDEGEEFLTKYLEKHLSFIDPLTKEI